MPHEAIIECDAQGPQVKKLSQWFSTQQSVIAMVLYKYLW